MAETNDDAAASKADAMALAAEAEAEAAEAEALAAAARAKARAARLRREALTAGAASEDDVDEDEDYEDEEEDEDYEDYESEYYDEDEEYEEGEEYEEAAGYSEAKGYSEAENYSEHLAVAAPASRRERLRNSVGVPKLSTIAKVAAMLLICGFIGISTYFVWQHDDAEDRQQKAAAFIAGAKQGVVNMTSLDFKKAKDDVQRVIDSSTGEFRDDFQQRAADFTKVVEQSKVVTEGTVNAAAVETMDGHSAQVLVSATSRVTNSAGAKDEPRSWRLRVTVTEEDGQYKMSKVEFVP
jgi:Mce-associated membrane protein